MHDGNGFMAGVLYSGNIGPGQQPRTEGPYDVTNSIDIADPETLGSWSILKK